MVKNANWDFKRTLSHLSQALKRATVLVVCPSTLPIFIEAMKIGSRMGHFLITLPQSAFVGEQPEVIRKIVRFSDLLLLNEKEACTYANTRSPRTAIERLKLDKRGIAVITRGYKGSLVVAESNLIYQQAFGKSIEDPSGAGDSLMAGFIWAISEGRDLKNAAYIGNAAAFLACKYPDLVERGFLIDDLLEMINQEI